MHLILGTAGHIDHGKTALIRALTGVDTDRLPEEKRRGITIELGFAELALGELQIGIVDVPGHERFVRQMLAGATGLDLAMLVIAADDSVKPQTREHLDVLQFLQIPAGVVVLTKCDNADPDWIELVEAEIDELLAGTFLAEAPRIRTSAVTGVGIEQLKAALQEIARGVVRLRTDQRSGRPFRMPIDRCFTLEGHGTVVTGSVVSGAVTTSETLTLAPAGVDVRVRAIHNHDQAVTSVERGQRAAINLAGVHHAEVERGEELISPDSLQPTRRVTVRLRMLDRIAKPLKPRATARLHLGTGEWMTRVTFPSLTPLAAGETSLAQMVLPRPAIATHGQPFVIRSESPLDTIAGGTVVSTQVPAFKRLSQAATRHLAALETDDAAARVAAAVYFLDDAPWEASTLVSMANVDDPEPYIETLCRDQVIRSMEVSSTRTIRIHQDRVAELAVRFVHYLARAHDAQPRRSLLPRQPIVEGFHLKYSRRLLDVAIDDLVRAREVRLTERGIGLTARGPQLSSKEHKLYETLLARYRDAGWEPPSRKEVAAEARHNRDALHDLLSVAVAEEELVEINSSLLLHAEAAGALREKLRPHLEQGGLTVSQIREILGTSRKFAVPLCEYLDRVGFTRRAGDVRLLVK